MKLQLYSDIHVEFNPTSTFQIPASNADLIMLAGDIGEGLAGITWAAEQSQRLGKSSLWLYGHTHASRDENLDGTRVISNQLGYPGERN